MKQQDQKLLLFGAGGAIGQQIQGKFVSEGWNVVSTGRHANPAKDGKVTWLQTDPTSPDFDGSVFDGHAPFTAICWAQGANLNDSAYDVNLEKHMELYRANCLFIVASLQKLLARKLLAPASRLCVISSIWQNMAKQNKLSYGMTKAALQGLVLSAAADLAVDGHLINAVLPGVLDTPMAHRNLTAEQVKQVTSSTKFNRLPTLDDVANLAFYLCSPQNTGITGQFITADLGFSHVRLL
jgi:NAD(P)-dependent dehydrogenase (short-subunit alcohol dehydrogenase family)